MGVSKNAAPTNAGEKTRRSKSVSCEAQAFRRWSVELQCFRSAHLLKILQAQELKSAVELDSVAGILCLTSMRGDPKGSPPSPVSTGAADI